MGKKSIVGWFVWCMCLAGTSFAKDIDIPQTYTVLHNVGEDWLVYDEGYGGYVPYMKDRHTKLKTLSFWLESQKYQPYRLLLYAEKGSYLYIQKRLAYRFDQAGWHSFAIDSLQRIYKENALFCTLYDGQYKLPLPAIAIVIINKKETTENVSKLATATNALDRTPRPNDHKDWAILSLALVLVCYISLYNYNPKTFSSFFSGRSSLSTLSRKDPSLIQKPLNMINFVYMGAHGLLLSYFYMLWAIQTDSNLSFLWIPSKTIFWGLAINQLYYLFCVCGILVGKMFLLMLFGRLLSVDRQIVQIHLFEYMRFSYLFYSVFGGLGALVFCCYPEYNSLFFNFALYFIPLFHIFQASVISFFVIRQLPFLNLYIFYYLCTTELTPWLIGIKSLLF